MMHTSKVHTLLSLTCFDVQTFTFDANGTQNIPNIFTVTRTMLFMNLRM